MSGYQSSQGLLTNYGVHVLRADNLLFASSFGPGVDGSLKPDLLAPSGALSTSVEFLPGGTLKGLYRLPPGYSVFSGTSCAAPMAAGAAALLVSAAKQKNVAHDAPSIYQALRASARFLDGVAAYRQGSGLIRVPEAWTELQSLAREGGPVRIRSILPQNRLSEELAILPINISV